MALFESFKKFKRNTQEGVALALSEANLYFSFSFKKRWLALFNEKLSIYFDKCSDNYSAKEFDNSIACLSWQGLELSKGLGLHMALNANGSWYDSSCASWQIKRLSQDKLYVEVIYRDIPVTQGWTIILTGENELSWDVGMRVREPVKISRQKMGVFVSSGYKRWFNASEEGEFPEGFNWENVFLSEVNSRWFGVKPEGKYPGIIFEPQGDGKPLLQNTNADIEGRAVQFEMGQEAFIEYQAGYYKVGSGRIKIIEDEKLISERIEEAKRIILRRQEEAKQIILQRQAEAKRQEIAAKTFSGESLKLFFDEGKVVLSWKGLELSKWIGLHMALNAEGKWQDSSNSESLIKRLAEDKVYVEIIYRDIPVTQGWTINLIGENELSWDVEMWIREPVKISQQKMGVFVSSGYKRWFNASEEGEFPEGFNWENVFLSEVNSRWFGVKPEGKYPGIIFEPQGDGKPLLQNTNADIEGRAVQFEMGQEAFIEYQAGYYKVGSGRIKIIEDEKLISERIEEAKQVILRRQAEAIEEARRQEIAAKTFVNDNLKLFFDEGKVILSWQGMELSKGLGLHMALNVNGSWHDSSCAGWQIKRISQDKLYVEVIYRDIPVTQGWTIILTGENELSWDVEMRVRESVKISRQKMGLFVSPEYKRWFNASEEGEFPEGFNWENVFLSEVNSRWFGVKPEGKYPGIIFEPQGDGKPLLQNTNADIEGRVVQFEIGEETNSQSYEPGEGYKLFSGKIKVIEDELEISESIENCKILPFDSLEAQTFYIFGDNEELHNKVAQSENSFKETLDKIKQALDKNKKVNLKVGVSRFNFFKVKEIVEFSGLLLGKSIDLSSVSLELFPVHKLYFNFINYLKQIKSKFDVLEIKLLLVDKELFDILSIVSGKANVYNERKLLRLLSVIVEQAFIGPQTVVIDPHHRCNVSCLHCWVHTPKITHTQEFLERKFDFEMYQRMIDDFALLKVDSIIFQGDGEPLLYNRFFDMVRYARSKNIAVTFFTNGQLLNNDIARETVELGVNQIFCSLPAGTEKTYSLVTHRENDAALGKVLGNLKYLTAVKRQKNKINPSLLMTHVIHALNYKEIVEMAHNDVDVGADIIRFYLIRLDDNIKFLQLKPEDLESIRESMCKVKEFLKDKHVELLDTTDFQLDHYEKDSGAWSKGVFLKEGCPLGWFFCLVPALGDISLCCHLRTVGYLKEKSFKEIWTSKEYEKYRVQAKFLKDNKDVTFLNGVKLYDEHCEHCDTHQVIREIHEDLKNYNLYKFAF